MKQDRTLRDILAQVLSRIQFIDGSFAKADRFLDILEEWKGEPPRHRRLVVGFDNPHSAYEQVLAQAAKFMELETSMWKTFSELKKAEEIAIHDLKMFKEDYRAMNTLLEVAREQAWAWKVAHDISFRANCTFQDEIKALRKEINRRGKMLKQEEKDNMDLITPSGNVVPMRRKGTTQPPTGTDDNWLSPLKVGDVFLAQRFQQRPDGLFALAPILEEYQVAVNEEERVKLLTTLSNDDVSIWVDPVEFSKQWKLKAVIGHVQPE